MTDWFTHTYSFTHWHVSNIFSDQYFNENDQPRALFMEREASGTIFVKIKQGWFQTKLGCSIDRPTRSRALIFSDQDILSLQLLAPDHHRHHHRHRQHRHRDCHPRHRHHHHSLIIVIVMVIIYLDIFFFCIEKYSRESVVQTTIFLLLPYCWILCLHKSEDLWNAFAFLAVEASFAIHNGRMEGERTKEGIHMNKWNHFCATSFERRCAGFSGFSWFPSITIGSFWVGRAFHPLLLCQISHGNGDHTNIMMMMIMLNYFVPNSLWL